MPPQQALESSKIVAKIVAIHRIATTQAHGSPEARAYLERRRQSGDMKMESLRVLKRRPSDVVFGAMVAHALVLRACTMAA